MKNFTFPLYFPSKKCIIILCCVHYVLLKIRNYRNEINSKDKNFGMSISCFTLTLQQKTHIKFSTPIIDVSIYPKSYTFDYIQAVEFRKRK